MYIPGRPHFLSNIWLSQKWPKMYISSSPQHPTCHIQERSTTVLKCPQSQLTSIAMENLQSSINWLIFHSYVSLRQGAGYLLFSESGFDPEPSITAGLPCWPQQGFHEPISTCELRSLSSLPFGGIAGL